MISIGLAGVLRWVIRGKGSVNTVIIPAETSQRIRAQRRRIAEQHARSRYRRIQASKTEWTGKFIAWDGESPKDAGYALFGNSEGDEICHPYLSTLECLALFIDALGKYPGAIHIWFGGNLDVSFILKDLTRRSLIALHKYNQCTWNDGEVLWQFKHIPHKWFEIRKGQQRFVIYDIHSYFGTGYANALNFWNVGSIGERGEITKGKRSRGDFVWRDIAYIRDYFRSELRLMPILAEQIRSAFSDAGYMPRSWHGPGGIARLALRRHGVSRAMATCPVEIRAAATYAFAGGRFEQFLGGYINAPIYYYDIHSAYPYFATFLPNLAKGKWRRTRIYKPGKFGIYHIRYQDAHADFWKPYPLFRRMEDGQVAWPYRVTGWYWNPEAALVAKDPQAKFLEGWVFDESDPNDRPFAWLADYYYRRVRLKSIGSATEYTFKLIINSVYGQLAQRAGWDRRRNRAPAFHQIEWAGWITSACRAKLYEVALSCGDKLISIDTDGLFTMAPVGELDIGDRLGQWECEIYDGGIFWQSGIYSLRDKDGWSSNKTRGIPADSYTGKDLLERLESNSAFCVECESRGNPTIPGPHIHLWQHIFITYGLAIESDDYSKINTWEDREHIYTMGGNGKRQHIARTCSKTCDGQIHRMAQPPFKYGPVGAADSVRHYLPWQQNNKRLIDSKTEMDLMEIITENGEDWQWARTLAA